VRGPKGGRDSDGQRDKRRGWGARGPGAPKDDSRLGSPPCPPGPLIRGLLVHRLPGWPAATTFPPTRMSTGERQKQPSPRAACCSTQSEPVVWLVSQGAPTCRVAWPVAVRLSLLLGGIAARRRPRARLCPRWEEEEGGADKLAASFRSPSPLLPCALPAAGVAAPKHVGWILFICSRPSYSFGFLPI
jgi:hypothetical protein